MAEDNDKPLLSRRGFIRFPPEEADPDDPPNLIVTADDESLWREDRDIWHHIALLHGHERFEESGNSVHALESFVARHEVGVYPPLSILRWLATCFEEWLKHEGERSMDEIMGLKRGRGQNTAFGEIRKKHSDDYVMLDIWRLKTAFGISTDDAATMEEALLQRDETTWQGVPAKPQSALHMRNKFSKYSGKNESYEFDDSVRDRLLRTYPAHSYEAIEKIQVYLAERDR